MRITPLVLAGSLVAAGIAGPAVAAPKPKPKPKPIVKTYDATAPTPDPTNWLSEGGVAGYSVCAQRVPESYKIFTFKAPALGKLNLKLTDFQGDWDALFMDSKNSELGAGGSPGINTPQDPKAGDENATIRVKKAGTTYKVVACNWAGGPTAKLTLTFTYA